MPREVKLSRRDLLRVAAGAGGLLVGGGLAACAAPAAPTPSKPASAPAPTAAPQPTAAAAAKKSVELSWIWTSNTAEEQQFWESQADSFRKKYPNVTVKPQFLGANDLYDKIQALASGGAVPDIIFWQGFRAQAWAARKIGQSLEPFIKRDKLDVEDFDPEIMKMMSYKGQVYALPYDFGAVMIIYNKDMFDAEGVKYPDANWTWDSFLDACTKLTKDKNGDGRPDQWGMVQAPDFVWGLVPFIWSNGGDYMDEGGTKSLLTMPETVQAIQWYADLRTKHKVAPTPEPGQWIWRDAFYTGKVGMFIDGPWQALTLRARAKFNWDFALIPKGKAGRVSWIAGSGYAVSATTKNPDEAWAFAKELTSKETLAALAKAGRGFPGRKSAMDAYLSVKPPAHPEMSVEALKSAKYMKNTATWQEITNLLNKEMDRVYLGEVTAEQAVKNVNPQFEDLLKKHLQLIKD